MDEKPVKINKDDKNDKNDNDGVLNLKSKTLGKLKVKCNKDSNVAKLDDVVNRGKKEQEERTKGRKT